MIPPRAGRGTVVRLLHAVHPQTALQLTHSITDRNIRENSSDLRVDGHSDASKLQCLAESLGGVGATLTLETVPNNPGVVLINQG